jgi:hypothetical protein
MKRDFEEAVVAGDPGREAELRSQVEGSFSRIVPAFLTFQVSQDGYVWTQEYQIERSMLLLRAVFPPRIEPVRWTVFDPDGTQLGDVEIPVGFSISEIGDDYILGVFRDDLGVEQVRMYSLVKP